MLSLILACGFVLKSRLLKWLKERKDRTLQASRACVVCSGHGTQCETCARLWSVWGSGQVAAQRGFLFFLKPVTCSGEVL